GQMAGMVTLLRARNVWKFGPRAAIRRTPPRVETRLLEGFFYRSYGDIELLNANQLQSFEPPFKIFS
ncbi:hypothetical protein, partial [Pseudovibrio sp. W74]|uniref:hypothetical protein n=2 Tax=unclassified Pseudovibrio TaxID=2627060 RepID=UPI0019D3271F